MRIACRVLHDPALVLEALVDSFIASEQLIKDSGMSGNNNEDRETDNDDARLIDPGVTEKGIQRFANHLIKHRAGLAGQVFKYNHVRSSLTSVSALDQYELLSGIYVVGAPCERRIRHCFVLHVPADDEIRTVYYEYNLENPVPEPLTNIEWIRSVQFAHKVQYSV